MKSVNDSISKREHWLQSLPCIDPIGGICWPEGEDLAPDGLERYTEGFSPLHAKEAEKLPEITNTGKQPL
jgi:hypothetical protein